MTEVDNDEFIKIDKMSVDQAAGAFVMIAGAIGSLLLVIWQSKCHCKMNLCYIFQCERRPPNEDEMKTLKEQTNKLKDPKGRSHGDTYKKEEKQDEKLIPTQSVEPEPEAEIDKLV